MKNASVLFERNVFYTKGSVALEISGSSNVIVSDLNRFTCSKDTFSATYRYAVKIKTYLNNSPEVSIYDNEFCSTVVGGVCNTSGGVIIYSGDVEIYNNIFRDMYNGIKIETPDNAPGPVLIRNNLIGRMYNGDGESESPKYGIGIHADDEDHQDLRILNNIIYDVEASCIRLSETSSASIRYNTLTGSDFQCVYVEGEGSGQEVIKDNVFNAWDWDASFAVEYENADAGAANDEPVDYNLYACNNPWAELDNTDYVRNVTPENEGPAQVWLEKFSINGPWADYFPWGAGKENDDVIGTLPGFRYEDQAWDPPYDFHLGNPIFDPEESIMEPSFPSWIDRNSQTEFYDEDEPIDPPWDLFRHHRVLPARNSLSDPGAYSGEYGTSWDIDLRLSQDDIESLWADIGDFVGYEGVNDDERIVNDDQSHMADPFIIVSDLEAFWWHWDGGGNDMHDFKEYARVYMVENAVNVVQPSGDTLGLGQMVYMMPENVEAQFHGMVTMDGTTFGTYSGYWGGIEISDSTNISGSEIINTAIYCADYGVYLSGADDTGGARMLLNTLTIDSCGIGVYANNSRLKIANSTIKNSDDAILYGNGIYLNNCSSGKVILDGNTITGNGIDSTYISAAVYLNSSDPEMIWNTIEDNNGAGISCYGSKPDLDTYDIIALDDQPNTIQDNGTGGQSGSDGAEIYLASSSYPSVKYNNIVEYSGGPVGYMIYKNSSNNTGSLTATNNYWGATPSSSFFYWGSGSSIDYTSYSGTELSSVEEFAIAERLWNEGEYAEAAGHFRNCASDTGSIGINSIHYLNGCVGEVEDGNFDDLREFLQETAYNHDDDNVAKVAARFATHCLTEQSLYEDAMEEYENRAINAECIQDSIAAVIDYISVEELSNGGHIDAIGSGSILKQISELMILLDNQNELGEANSLTPDSYTLNDAFPNPFNSTTTIGFNLMDEQHVSLQVFDLTGRLVDTLVDERLGAGRFTSVWKADLQAAGVYFYRLQAGSFQQTKKLTLIK